MCLANKRFPCGQCMACRLNKQREKAMRISHELQYHKDSVFITLTYDDKHLPSNNSLVKSDVQKFLKRLRKRIGVERVRYFLCGEYGEQGNRPHYHLIVFGLRYSDSRIFEDLQYKPSQDVYYCKCKCWDKGFVSVGKVNQARIDYVAKYVVKKITGKIADEYYGDRLPEFSLSSKNPGLGYKYAKDHENRLKQDDYCTVRGVKCSIPRYYIDKLYDPIDKIRRSHKRDDVITEMYESHRDEFDHYGAMRYAKLVQDKLNTAKEIIARRLQSKGKTKCQVK